MKLTIENEFKLLQPDWVQLSPYGDFEHARGLQRVDKRAAETMARNFNSLRHRIGRLFGGVPFYVGHPDMPAASDTADKKAYGWINQLEARDDGLFGLVKWSEAGLKLLRNGHFKFFSPYWEAEEIGSEGAKRVYRPVLLISVGLTNQPNLPVSPLANTASAVPPQLVPGDAPDEIRTRLDNAISLGLIAPADEKAWQERFTQNFANAAAELEKAKPKLRVTSRTGGLRLRRDERALANDRRETVQRLLRRKMRDGLNYDEAWHELKRERPGLFQD